MTAPTPLKRQLEMARFERAMEVAESLADHRALLTTAVLAPTFWNGSMRLQMKWAAPTSSLKGQRGRWLSRTSTAPRVKTTPWWS